MARILSARPVIDHHTPLLKKRVLQLKDKGIDPLLKVVLVGNHPASLVYTRNKAKFAKEIGAECQIITLPEQISKKHFLAEITQLSTDSKVHGIIIQLPLPPQLSPVDLHGLVPPEKDVDGFHRDNLFQVLHGGLEDEFLCPCTPKGIISLLNFYKIPLMGAKAVMIGRSMIVGRPMALMLNTHNSTVTLCHAYTKNLKDITRQADLIICAVGKARMLNASYFSPEKKPVVVDVGINRDKQGKLCGDVDFDNVLESVSAITPVPGGVGPLTVLSLMENLVFAAEQSALYGPCQNLETNSEEIIL